MSDTVQNSTLCRFKATTLEVLIVREYLEETTAILAMKTMWILALWIIPLLKLCCAQRLVCNATQLPQGTFYSVSKLKATECPYSWINSTGHVLSNEKGKMDDLVFNSSIGTLFTRTCFSQLNYTRDCVSERIQQTAYCFIDCIIQAPLKEKGISRQYWGTIASVSSLVLVLLGLLSCVLRRNQ